MTLTEPTAAFDRNGFRRLGLTLIELVVVLVILVGLGGLLVPVISNALTRTHVATCSQNFPEITNALMRMETLRGVYGNFWDSALADGTTVVNLDTGTGSGAPAYPTLTLTQGHVNALAGVGITDVFDHTATPSADYNITFNPEYTAARPLAVGGLLLGMDDVHEAALSLDTAGVYVVLGMGPNWSGLRDVAFEVPVHFGDTPGDLPDEKYSRFQAIFQVADAAGELPVARFKGVTIGLTGEDYETAGFHTAIYWTEVDEQ